MLNRPQVLAKKETKPENSLTNLKEKEKKRKKKRKEKEK